MDEDQKGISTADTLRGEQRVIFPAFFDGHEFRFVHIGKEAWMVLADAAKYLGYSVAWKAARLIPEKFKGQHKVGTIARGEQNMIVVHELGFYALLNKTESPKAKGVQLWAIATTELLTSAEV